MMVVFKGAQSWRTVGPIPVSRVTSSGGRRPVIAPLLQQYQESHPIRSTHTGPAWCKSQLMY